MSQLFLIRHGQASFGSKNYDQLSDIGRLQASALGNYYLTQNFNFSQIIHGNLSRQQETAQLMAKAMGMDGELKVNPAANEFDSDSLLNHYLPKLVDSSSTHAEMIGANQQWLNNEQIFEAVLRALLALWQKDEKCPFESWLDFRGRVLAMLETLNTGGEDKQRIALVTSGGFISIVLQSILRFDDEVLVDINLTINNASVSEIKLGNGNSQINSNKLSLNRLISFNNISALRHSDRKDLVTRK